MNRYVIRNIVTPLNKEIDFEKEISNKLKIDSSQIGNIKIQRRAIDARKKNRLKFNYVLECELSNDNIQNNDLSPFTEAKTPKLHTVQIDKNPVIIGSGPAGTFAALAMVEAGLQPIIFEKGEELENRNKSVDEFWKNGILNEKSNVQFGEGGAGMFSDGKLTARNRNYFSAKVFEYLIKFGADESIAIDTHPHLGTDKLVKIQENMREYLKEKGCKFHFNSELEDIEIENEKIKSITINNEKYEPEIVILAIGNSARNTFKMLYDKGIAIESKPFAVGFRIEHQQKFIDYSFYGKKNNFSISGPASYRLKTKIGDRGAYSFCMCPGGFVIPASSAHGRTVVNGMSYSDRANDKSNSALVVTIDKKDYGKKPLDGMWFQEMIEQKSYYENEIVKAQLAKDFMVNKISNNKKIKGNSMIHTVSKNLRDLYPSKITTALHNAFSKFENQTLNFIDSGILYAAETRTSSPIQIVRDKKRYNSINCNNLYPIGEGSGFAGGIISSAADGFRIGSQFCEG